MAVVVKVNQPVAGAPRQVNRKTPTPGPPT